MYDCWWEPFRLDKMGDHYSMQCNPKPGANLHVSQFGRYDFEMKWERKIRGHKFYRQRYWKGKWKH